MEEKISFGVAYKERMFLLLYSIKQGWYKYKTEKWYKRIWLYLKRGYKICFHLIKEGEVIEPK